VTHNTRYFAIHTHIYFVFSIIFQYVMSYFVVNLYTRLEGSVQLHAHLLYPREIAYLTI